METSLESKAYKFVPLTSTINRSSCNNYLGENYKNLYSGKFVLSIKCLTPIHIGQGTVHVDSKGIIKEFMRKNEKIVIPGSSLKGMLRSIYEAASLSCSPKLPNDCKALANALPNQKKYVCNDINCLCPTCSVFGFVNGEKSKKSKLRFSEFKLSNQNKESVELIAIHALKSPFTDYPIKFNDYNRPRCFEKNTKDYGNERLYYADLLPTEEAYDNLTKSEYYNLINGNQDRNLKFRGRKFYLHNVNYQEKAKYSSIRFETVKKDSIFKGELFFEGLTEEEMSILAYILSFGTDDNFKYKIGYGKPAYFGSVEINIDEIKKSPYSKNIIDKDALTILANNYKEQASDELKNILNKISYILSDLKLGPKWLEVGGNKVY